MLISGDEVPSDNLQSIEENKERSVSVSRTSRIGDLPFDDLLRILDFDIDSLSSLCIREERMLFDHVAEIVRNGGTAINFGSERNGCLLQPP